MKYRKFSTFIERAQYGYTADETSTVDGDAKYLRITDIVPYFVDKDRVPFCMISEKKKAQYLVKENDLLIARTGATTGYNLIVPKGFSNYVFASYLVRYFYKQDELFPQYLKHVLKSKQYYGFVNNYIGGSAQPGMNPRAFGRFEIPYVCYQKQKQIACILSTYDNLIEVNNKRIKILEQMAENLYKEWFVRFRFPGHETAEFENEIPKRWETTRLGEIMSFTRGVGYSSEDIVDGETALLSMNNIRPYGGYISDNSRVYSGKYKKDQLIEENDLMMSITDMTQDRRIIGYTGIANYSEMPRVICTHLMKITSNEYDNFFLYSFFTYSGLSRYISEYATGANVLGLTADILKRIKCNIPDVRMAKRFSEKVKPVFYHIHLLEKSNSILIKQRDLLLPRLMSGRLEV